MSRWPWLNLLLLLLAVHFPLAADARSLADLASQARQLDAEWRQLRAGGTVGAAAEQSLIERLGKLVLVFLDESDEAARAGTEQQQRGALRPVFDAIHGPLDAIYSARNERIERLTREVMDADGDLEALYETREWHEAQAVAAQSLYYLNWLNLYGARLYEGSQRRELLDAAERGFSQFATGDRTTELLTESLLGRGLCHLELGNFDWAIRDFRTVIDQPGVSPERKAKAQLALLDAYSRAGRVKETLQHSQDLLGSGTLAQRDAALVSFFRLQVLMKAIKGASPRDAEGYRREASALMDQLRRAGSGWADKVDALMVTQVDDPAQWAGKVRSPAAKWELARLLLQKGDEKTATSLLEEIVADDRPEARPFHAQAHYWLGVGCFKAGDHTAAADHFDAALLDAKPEFAADAAYWRFKALEALMAQKPDDALGQRYAAALRDLLARFPEHKSAAEVHYRLGEYLQGGRQFDAALAEYDRVAGDPGFELRARFGMIQSAFELLKEGPDPAKQKALLARIGADLERFQEQARAFERQTKQSDVPLKEFQAKVTVFRAVYTSLTVPDGDARIADLLADFPRRYPDQRDLHAQAVRLRLGALRGLGRFTEAEKETADYFDVLRAEGNRDALEKLAASFVQAGARRKAQGDAAGAKAAAQVALRLYQALPAAGGGADDKTKLTLAQLYEGTEPERAEALYQELIQQNENSVVVLRGLARVAEARNQLPQALGYWARYTAATRPGDPPWYEGRYQQARLKFASGDRRGCCEMLKELRPAMPGLSDADLRRQLNELHQQACE